MFPMIMSHRCRPSQSSRSWPRASRASRCPLPIPAPSQRVRRAQSRSRAGKHLTDQTQAHMLSSPVQKTVKHTDEVMFLTALVEQKVLIDGEGGLHRPAAVQLSHDLLLVRGKVIRFISCRRRHTPVSRGNTLESHESRGPDSPKCLSCLYGTL